MNFIFTSNDKTNLTQNINTFNVYKILYPTKTAAIDKITRNNSKYVKYFSHNNTCFNFHYQNTWSLHEFFVFTIANLLNQNKTVCF
jgi:hypothetical protein